MPQAKPTITVTAVLPAGWLQKHQVHPKATRRAIRQAFTDVFTSVMRENGYSATVEHEPSRKDEDITLALQINGASVAVFDEGAGWILGPMARRTEATKKEIFEVMTIATAAAKQGAIAGQLEGGLGRK